MKNLTKGEVVALATAIAKKISGEQATGISSITWDGVTNSLIFTLSDGSKVTTAITLDASDVSYSNASSGLSATHVQQAIDEVLTTLNNDVEELGNEQNQLANNLTTEINNLKAISVLTTPQTLTPEQQTQVKSNLNISEGGPADELIMQSSKIKTDSEVGADLWAGNTEDSFLGMGNFNPEDFDKFTGIIIGSRVFQASSYNQVDNSKGQLLIDNGNVKLEYNYDTSKFKVLKINGDGGGFEYDDGEGNTLKFKNAQILVNDTPLNVNKKQTFANLSELYTFLNSNNITRADVLLKAKETVDTQVFGVLVTGSGGSPTQTVSKNINILNNKVNLVLSLSYISEFVEDKSFEFSNSYNLLSQSFARLYLASSGSYMDYNEINYDTSKAEMTFLQHQLSLNGDEFSVIELYY